MKVACVKCGQYLGPNEMFVRVYKLYGVWQTITPADIQECGYAHLLECPLGP